MSRTVHGLLLALIVTVLCSGISGLLINHEEAAMVTEKYPYNNMDLETLQLVEPSIQDYNHVEFIPEGENDIGPIIEKIKKTRTENEVLQNNAILGEADVKHRMTRQANHQYTPLYPQLPSGPPYNPYQPQPNSGPSGQSPYQPGYNPYGQNANQPQTSYNPYTPNPSQPQPSYNPYTPNPNQPQPSYNPYTPKPNQPQPTYNPYSPNVNPYQPAGQNQFTQRPPQWNSNSYNSSRPGNVNPYNSSTGQSPYNSPSYFPSQNNTYPGNSYTPPTFNSSNSYRLPNAASSSFTTLRPGQSPYNNYRPSSGNSYPVQPSNSTYRPYPTQYPAYNNSRPNPTQWPSSTNNQYPNYPGARPAQGTYNSTLPKPNFPGPNGQFPSNSYNPSIPNYPPQNQGQNNFYYPQNNSTASYDPRRVPSQNFSYH